MPKQVATKAEFDAILAESGDKLVVVDFTATWCGPCQMIAPTYAKMAEEYTGCVFIKVDVDENEETAESYGIQAMPTFKFFKNSESVVDGEGKAFEIRGANKAKLREAVEQYK
jgi:thioredoxin 1